jgi:hypothetical protein
MLTHQAAGTLGVAALSALRSKLKSAEFYLPPRLASMVIRATGAVGDPYTGEMDELRCIFVHIPKTAGTSIAKAVFKTRTYHIPAARFQAIDAGKFSRYFKFCVVRNPYDRLHSAYEYLRPHVGKEGFLDFVWATENLAAYDSFEAFVLAMRDRAVRGRIMRYTHFRPQHHWVRLPFGSACAMDKVGRYENLAEDYREITDRLGVTVPDLPLSRKGPAGDYRGVYTPAMKAIVEEMYGADLKLFGYGFD